MKITTKLKLNSLLVLTFLLSNVVVAVVLTQRINSDVRRLVEVEEPLEQAILEMEINAGETLRGVFDYIHDLDQRGLDVIHDSEEDFERYAQIFEQLVETDRERELGLKVSILYQEFKKLGDEIVSLVARQYADLDLFRKYVEEIDQIVDEKLQPAIDRSSADALIKLEAVLDMEININEAFAAIEGYVLKPDPKLRHKIHDSEADFERFEAQLRGTSLTAYEKRWLSVIDKDFAEAVTAGNEIIELTDQLNEKREQFEENLIEIDRILDDEIRVLILEETHRVAKDVRSAGRTAISFILIFGILTFLTVAGVSWFVSTEIYKGINRLTVGAEAFGNGDLDYHIETETKDELSVLAGTFNEMVEMRKRADEALIESEARKWVEKVESLNLLAGSVAHDLNNIIGPILAYPDLIKINLSEGLPVDEDLDAISSSAERAADVISSLLALAQSGKYKMEPIDLNDLVYDYLKSAEFKSTKELNPEVDANIQLSGDRLLFKGSKAHLPKVLMNLVNNSFESMQEGGVLSLSTSSINVKDGELSEKNIPQGRYNLLTIEDEGEGISEENISKIFDPFFTTKIKTQKSGSGLGLSVVYNVLKEHGAVIDVESKLGKGAKFSIYFPTTTEKKEIVPEVKEREQGSGSVLVVDDRVEQRHIASLILSKLGYDVKSVESGEKAIEYLTEKDTDLVWLDMILEDGMDGLDTYKEIIKIRSGQKTIIVSGYSETDRVKEAEQLGANGFIQKPYKMDIVGDTISRILSNN